MAVVADIESMFHQVRVSLRDRDALRFLWWPGGNTEEKPVAYRMTVHLFGAKSSPSCAAFCLKEAAKEFGKYFEPNIARNVQRCFYVDDFLSCSRNCAEGIKLVEGMREIMAMAGFNLTKWQSTSAKVMESIPDSHKGKAESDKLFGNDTENVVLGIKWSLAKDEFYFAVEKLSEARKLTKQVLLSATNSLYDPLGFLAPVVLEARLIYRNACREQRDWDEQLSDETGKRWKRWCTSLDQLRDIRIPRCCQVDSEHQGLQLHFFSDASSFARGCVCYLRITRYNNVIECYLVMGKALLADKKRTIPQLELEAALDAVKMSRVVKKELELEDCMCMFWTDSSAVLLSLRADSRQFPVYFKNRLARIQQYTSVHDWRHVPTDLNPADQASRGATAAVLLKTETWLHGPKFLYKRPELWPDHPLQKQVVSYSL